MLRIVTVDELEICLRWTDSRHPSHSDVMEVFDMDIYLIGSMSLSTGILFMAWHALAYHMSRLWYQHDGRLSVRLSHRAT